MPRFVVPFLLVFMWLVSVQSVSADQYIDPDLAAAIVVMRSMATGEEVYQQYLEVGVTVVRFDDVQLDVGGVTAISIFEPNENAVYLGERLRSESVFAQAAWILHELSHAWQAYNGEWLDPMTQERCIQLEVDAYTVQSRWWQELFGDAGKSNPTEAEGWENNRLEWYLVDNMQGLLDQWDAYQNYCRQFATGVVEEVSPETVPISDSESACAITFTYVTPGGDGGQEVTAPLSWDGITIPDQAASWPEWYNYYAVLWDKGGWWDLYKREAYFKVAHKCYLVKVGGFTERQAHTLVEVMSVWAKAVFPN